MKNEAASGGCNLPSDKRHLAIDPGTLLCVMDTVACFTLILCHDGVFTQGPELRAALLVVLHIEDLRNRNSHGTSFGTVLSVTLPGQPAQTLDMSGTDGNGCAVFSFTASVQQQNRTVSYIPGCRTADGSVVWYEALAGSFTIPQVIADTPADETPDATGEGTETEVSGDGAATDAAGGEQRRKFQVMAQRRMLQAGALQRMALRR